jgi:hypothetical protein
MEKRLGGFQRSIGCPPVGAGLMGSGYLERNLAQSTELFTPRVGQLEACLIKLFLQAVDHLTVLHCGDHVSCERPLRDRTLVDRVFIEAYALDALTLRTLLGAFFGRLLPLASCSTANAKAALRYSPPLSP